jgi:ubiquinol-cytochrome c reductase cytochrome b subunit
MRLINNPLFSILNDHLVDYPTPINISYMWGFGSLAGICLLIQLITGKFNILALGDFGFSII